MSLTKYRRHTVGQCSKGCKEESDSTINCHCWLSVMGTLRGQFIRRTAGTRSASIADELIREAEKNGVWRSARRPKDDRPIDYRSSEGHSIVDVVDEYTDYLHSPNADIEKGTIINRRRVARAFAEWCNDKNIRFVQDITPVDMVNFQDSWGGPFGSRDKGLSPATQTNYITLMKAFGEYCELRGKCKTNFAAKLKRAGKRKRGNKYRSITEEQFALLEQAAGAVTDKRPKEISGFRALTHLYIMRHAGMAITDASLLSTDKIVGDEVHYYRVKTQKQPNRILVKVPLPGWLLERLKVLEKEGLFHGKYYFAMGTTELPGVGTTWRNYLTPIFAAAGMSGCPSHSLRHAFAEEELLRIIAYPDGTTGMVPVEVVAMWMGHASVQTTINDYNATIEKRNKIASDIRRLVLAQEELKLKKGQPEGWPQREADSRLAAA